MPIFAVGMRYKGEQGVRAEQLGTGQIRVFKTVREASAGLGVTQQAVSRALARGGLCRGCSLSRVQRFWMVKDSAGEYLVCRRDRYGRFESIGRSGGVIDQKNVVAAKEITVSVWTEEEENL
jgi:hypothetical protein